MKKQTGIDIIETSAKNSFKITEAMETITKKLMEKSSGGEQGAQGGNNVGEKIGMSLGDGKDQSNNGSGCC